MESDVNSRFGFRQVFQNRGRLGVGEDDKTTIEYWQKQQRQEIQRTLERGLSTHLSIEESMGSLCKE